MSTPPSAASAPPDRAASTAREIAEWLTRTPRQLPSHFLYDALGSALFEAICRLPWYRITRTEQQLLAAHAADIFTAIRQVSTIVELGPGSGAKLLTLLSAQQDHPLRVHLVDVSSEALEQASRTLQQLPDVAVDCHQATYEAGLADAASSSSVGTMLVVFLGSNIGNFDRDAAGRFLTATRRSMRRGDALLLGADLVKPEAELLRAYDDPLGVTAAFNRNLLVRMNRELGAEVDVHGFAHRAVWNEAESRIEMHLVSQRAQRIRIPAAGLDIAINEGETIWTESSYKYRPEDLGQMLARAGFATTRQWTLDRFALTLAEAD